MHYIYYKTMVLVFLFKENTKKSEAILQFFIEFNYLIFFTYFCKENVYLNFLIGLV